MAKYKIPWANPILGKEELQEVRKSFISQTFTSGKQVQKFEKLLSSYIGSKYCVAVTNGTIALDIALKAIKIKKNDEVILPALTYFSSASSISYQGAIPVFVDIDPNTFNIDPNKIKEAINTKTKAIIYIDYGGNPAEIDKIQKIAKKNKIPIVHDAAQSLGAIYKNKKLGMNGNISTMSFHMAKIITTIEGGAIFTNQKKIYEELLTRRNIGEPKQKKYYHTLLGTNARMTELNAAIGIKQLRKLEKFVKDRNKIAKQYDNNFKEANLDIKVLDSRKKNFRNSYFFYPILIKKRNFVANSLRHKYNIDTRIAYPMPIYKQPLYKNKLQSYKKFECPNAEMVSSRILNLPIYPGMKLKDIKKVVNSIKEILQSD